MDANEQPDSTTDPAANVPSSAQWVTLAAAADHAGVSINTARRRVVDGKWPGEKREGRWWVDETNIQPAATRTGTTEAVLTGRMAGAGLVPIEVFQRIEEVWRQVVEAEARAQVAETKWQFEVERRQGLEERIAELEAAATPAPTPTPTEPEPAKDLGAELDELRAFELEKRVAELEAMVSAVEPPTEPLPDIPDVAIEEMGEELKELRAHQQKGDEPEPPEQPWPDIPDETVTRLSAEVEELRPAQPPRPWWQRILFGRPRRQR